MAASSRTVALPQMWDPPATLQADVWRALPGTRPGAMPLFFLAQLTVALPRRWDPPRPSPLTDAARDVVWRATLRCGRSLSRHSRGGTARQSLFGSGAAGAGARWMSLATSSALRSARSRFPPRTFRMEPSS